MRSLPLVRPNFRGGPEKHADVTFAKVNTEEQQELAGAFNIRSIPTLMVFREQAGHHLRRSWRATGETVFGELIEQVNALDMDQVRADIAAQSN